jgi:hypothetical protein
VGTDGDVSPFGVDFFRHAVQARVLDGAVSTIDCTPGYSSVLSSRTHGRAGD